MHKRIIFRVDDRLIHGQVIEGWIKYYKIKDVIIVSDNLVKDELKKTIYKSIIPNGVNLRFYSVVEFRKNFDIKRVKNNLLVLFEDVDSFLKISDLLSEDIFINIGCIANRKHKIEISDTVFLTKKEILSLTKLREKFMIYIKKLPWETSVDIKNFDKLVQ